MKKCNKCNKIKELKHFSRKKSQKDGYNYWCKECCKENASLWQLNNVDKSKTRQSVWAKKNPDKVKNTKLKDRYGITLEQYNRMLLQQQDQCKICGMNEKRLFVDHDHVTGKVRGLLCFSCNTALGHFKDSVTFIESALNYLKYSK